MTAVPGQLDGAPAEYLIPARRPTLAQAQLWCRTLAATHYENFHVATWFLPKRIRPYFESIYAFSRTSDDLGDEVPDKVVAMRLLREWEAMLDQCYDAPAASMHPVYVALRQTIDETGAPRQLFADLIHAFMQDQTKTHYETLDELIDYSRLSANPVGRLVLWVSGYHDVARAQLSDRVCTALQLINFWQDVVEDDERGRRYLPGAEMRRFGVTDAQIASRQCTPEFRQLMAFVNSYALAMLRDAGAIPGTVDRELATTLRLFVQGGEAAAAGVAAQGYDVLRRRPQVSKAMKAKLLTGALLGKAASVFSRPGARL